MGVLLVAAARVPARAEPQQAQVAQSVVDKAVAAYRSAKTYRDTFEYELLFVTESPEGADTKRQITPGSLSFRRPNQFALHLDDTGAHLQIDGIHQWMRYRNVYTQQPVTPTPSITASVPLALGAPYPEHPVAQLLARPDASFREAFPAVKELTGAERRPFEGRDGTLVTGTVDHIQAGAAVAFEAWFADADGLLRWITFDLTRTAQRRFAASQQGMDLKQCRMSIRLKDVRVNEPIAEDVFHFRPEAKDVQVPGFHRSLLQLTLIGQPAPDFTGPDLAGDKTWKLSDLRGRVVVLDFWATWCGPCLVLMPHFQRIADEYANRPVLFLGVNSDSQEQVPMARMYLQQRDIRMEQVWDEVQTITTLYQIDGIPCSILIDAKGIVQAIHGGFDPEHLRRDLDTLLQGRDIHDAEQIKAMLSRHVRRR